MIEETRQDKEQRLQTEYAAYVALRRSNGVEAINYMNWVSSAKVKDKKSKGERVFDRREKFTTKNARVKAGLPERRKHFITDELITAGGKF